MTRRGLTLIEAVLCTFIVGTLIVLVAGSLADSRRRARQIVTLARMRECGVILHAYANDWRDAWPAFARPYGGPTVVPTSRGDVEIPRYFFSCFFWDEALADGYLDGNPRSAVVFDAEQQAENGGVGGTAFLLSCSLLADPAYWRADTRTGASQWRGTRRYEVWRTDKKCLLVSPFVFDRVANIDVNGPLGGFHVPFAFADGSASRVRAEQVRRGVFNGEGTEPGTLHPHDFFAGLHTVDGVRGIDVR